MSIPNIDTFEHDIAEEIKTKEASMTDIASAGGDVGNVPSSRAQTSNTLLIIGGLFIVVVLVVFISILFFYGNKGASSADAETPGVSLPTPSNKLLAVSPTMYDALGGNIGAVTKSEYGYSMQLVSYTAVFSYMLKNENAYADELAIALGSPREGPATTTPYFFTDTTINNQNMRVGTFGSSTVVYAFINAKTLVISSSTQGILALRSGILSQ
jgi:hypothetical protein